MLLLAIAILFKSIYRKITKRIKLISFKLFFYNYQKIRILFPKIALILIFFSCFIFINLSLFTNSIKTNVVVINTDQLIDSQTKLDRTNKIPIFYEGSTSYEIAAFEKMKKRAFFIQPNTIGIKNLTELLDKTITSYYFCMDKVVIYVTIYCLSSDLSKFDYYAFKKEANYYETFKVMYYRKSMRKDKKKVLKKRYILKIK